MSGLKLSTVDTVDGDNAQEASPLRWLNLLSGQLVQQAFYNRWHINILDSFCTFRHGNLNLGQSR